MPITGTQAAVMPARLGVLRLGASRLNYAEPFYRFVINGVLIAPPLHVEVEGCSIHDLLDGTPNTATVRCDGFVPGYGHEIKIYRGDLRPSHLEFAGHIISRTAIRTEQLVQWDCSCISYEWLLNNRKITQRWMSESASVIAAELMEGAPDGVSTAGVQPDLEVLDEFTLTNEDRTTGLDRLKDRIGAHWVEDYEKVLHFGTAIEPGYSAVHPITDAADHGMREPAVTWDLSQVRTRALGEAGGAQAAVGVQPGDTILPVEDPIWYPVDGWVASGPQRISYDGVDEGGAGALVGSSAQPTAAPSVAINWGSGMAAGDYLYAVTFTDASGETLPGPTASITLAGTISPPSVAPVGSLQGGGGTQSTGNYQYVYTFSNGVVETTASPASNVVDVDFNTDRIGVARSGLSVPPSGFDLKFYRDRDTESGTYKRMDGPSDGFDYDDATYYYSVTDPVTGSNPGPPASNTAIAGQVALSGIPLGPSGTTGRKVYRTVVGGSQLKLLTTIADNTTTTHTDSAADGTLGANVPTANTATLVSEDGTVLAGATTIPVTGVGWAQASGGWATAGNQPIRYTGTTGNSLTGIPASGEGALAGTLTYGTAITGLPMLLGIPASGAGSIRFAIAKGDDVNLWVIRNDIAAQTALADLLSTPTHAHDGVIEDSIQDRRLSYDEMVNRLDALLLERKDPIVGLRYITPDQTTRSGREISFQKTVLGIPVARLFMIQSVTISDFDSRGINRPWRSVDASSRRFSLEDLLRIVKVT